jgi:hypothetical protein
MGHNNCGFFGGSNDWIWIIIVIVIICCLCGEGGLFGPSIGHGDCC